MNRTAVPKPLAQVPPPKIQRGTRKVYMVSRHYSFCMYDTKAPYAPQALTFIVTASAARHPTPLTFIDRPRASPAHLNRSRLSMGPASPNTHFYWPDPSPLSARTDLAVPAAGTVTICFVWFAHSPGACVVACPQPLSIWHDRKQRGLTDDSTDAG